MVYTFLGKFQIQEVHLNQQVCGTGNIEHKNIEPSIGNEELDEKAFNHPTGELTYHDIQMYNFLE